MWQCSECGTMYDEEDIAKACCDSEEEEGDEE